MNNLYQDSVKPLTHISTESHRNGKLLISNRKSIMIMTYTDFIHKEDQSQFQLTIEDEIAHIDYINRDGVLYLTHSEVPHELRGQGIGLSLVEKTFEYIEQNNLKAIAICSFIKAVAMRPRWSKVIGI